MQDHKPVIHAMLNSYFQFLNEKNWQAACSLMAEQVLHDVNQGDRVIGVEPLFKYHEEMARYYQQTYSDWHILVSADGKRASAEFYVDGKYLKTHGMLPPGYGQQYELPQGIFFEIEDGKISRLTHYFNVQSFIEQIK